MPGYPMTSESAFFAAWARGAAVAAAALTASAETAARTTATRAVRPLNSNFIFDPP